MIPTVSRIRPADVLRRSSDQIRNAAAILAQIADDTAGTDAERFGALFPGQLDPEVEELNTRRDSTIRIAQRSFSGRLRLAQDGEPR